MYHQFSVRAPQDRPWAHLQRHLKNSNDFRLVRLEDGYGLDGVFVGVELDDGCHSSTTDSMTT